MKGLNFPSISVFAYLFRGGSYLKKTGLHFSSLSEVLAYCINWGVKNRACNLKYYILGYRITSLASAFLAALLITVHAVPGS